MTEIKIDGLDSVIKMFNRIGKLDGLKAAIQAAGVHIKGKIAKYPHASSANAPSSVPGGRWYERGLGGHYNRIRDGGHSIYRTSETLGRRWATRQEDGGMTVVVGNNASYAPYVQGEKQTWYHAAREWTTTEQVAQEETAKVVKMIRESIKKEIDKIR